MVTQLLELSPVLTWENVPVEWNAVADVMMQAFEKQGESDNYKDSKIRWLLVSCIDTLCWNHERLKVINYKQFLAKWEKHKAFGIAYKETFISARGREYTAEWQDEDLIVRVAKLQRHWNAQLRQVWNGLLQALKYSTEGAVWMDEVPSFRTQCMYSIRDLFMVLCPE